MIRMEEDKRSPHTSGSESDENSSFQKHKYAIKSEDPPLKHRSSHEENSKLIKLIKNSDDIFRELIKNQLPTVPIEWKLSINDMKRICKYINSSIFDPDECCIWNGYVTNMNNINKGTYVNFYFRNKKVALHRLLYSNFVTPLSSDEYLKFNCENKGICCNINHYEKYKYSKAINGFKKETTKKQSKKEIQTVKIMTAEDEDLVIDFD